MKRPFELVAEIQQKDAEVQRLKNIIAATEVERDAADKVCRNKDRLIRELCEALEDTSFDVDLIQRAREATR